VERRSLLRAAVAAPALPLIGSAAAGFDAGSPCFTLAVLPDTQYLFDADSTEPTPVRAALDHLMARRQADNIAFLAQLGDLTEHGTAVEMTAAGETFRRIDGRLPYSVLAGNHDVDALTDDRRGGSAYLASFGPERFRGQPTFLGASADGYNTAHRFAAAGRQWLVLALDWRASDDGLSWARGVLAANPTLPTIVTTHDVAFSDETGKAFLSGNGQRLWAELIRDSDQIFLALGGHDWPPGRTVLTNAAGHAVHVHVTNYQDRYYGGAGMIRLYRMDLTRDRIDVETYSPWLRSIAPALRAPLEAETAELTGEVDRFSLEVDFERRFGPPAAPATRVASQVVDRDTVAYWRFDTVGQSVADGAVVRDQTGNGNDLMISRLPGSGPAVLTLSADHHAGAPAQASLRFDGGIGPDRGALLRTGPGAAVNGMTFRDGYTIEVFLKLPSPFVGEHSWMGVFSFEGRAADAGKSAALPLEPPCSLNLAPDRFLQFVLHPADGDDNPTAWSHALPLGVWQHVAVVNDGGRGAVWVDGSRMARNPVRPARGIATTGRPFVLGATSYDLRYRQSFCGWIGDARITARALKPAEFLPAGRFR
jgi:hypothetical protein